MTHTMAASVASVSTAVVAAASTTSASSIPTPRAQPPPPQGEMSDGRVQEVLELMRLEEEEMEAAEEEEEEWQVNGEEVWMEEKRAGAKANTRDEVMAAATRDTDVEVKDVVNVVVEERQGSVLRHSVALSTITESDGYISSASSFQMAPEDDVPVYEYDPAAAESETSYDSEGDSSTASAAGSGWESEYSDEEYQAQVLPETISELTSESQFEWRGDLCDEGTEKERIVQKRDMKRRRRDMLEYVKGLRQQRRRPMGGEDAK